MRPVPLFGPEVVLIKRVLIKTEKQRNLYLTNALPGPIILLNLVLNYEYKKERPL